MKTDPRPNRTILISEPEKYTHNYKMIYIV